MPPDAADIDIRYALKLAPAEAVDYFRAKHLVITEDWRDLWQQAHTRAFTVAKMTERDLLAKTRAILDRKLADGLTARQAAAELKDEFIKSGWWRKPDGSGGPGTPWRIRTILRTNAATAYSAGRHRRQKANAHNRPWWRYVAVMDGVTRLAHRQLHGKILRHDDPAWEAIYPPNGFNCRCRVTAMTDEQAAAAADKDRIDHTQVDKVDLPVGVDPRTGEVTHPVTHRPGARVTLTDRTGQVRYFDPDPGWAHRPGAWPPPAALTAAEKELTKQAAAATVQVRKTLSAGRRWRVVGGLGNWEKYGEPEVLPGHKPEKVLAAGASLDEGDAIARGVFGVGANGVIPFYTPLGPVAIRGENFRHVVEKRDERRERFANRIPPTLRDPDEVWRALYLNEKGDYEWRRHYIRAYNDRKNGFVIATETADGGLFFNFIPQGGKSINKRRVGVLLYTRDRGLLRGIE